MLLAVFAGYFYMTYMGGNEGELVADMIITSEKNEKMLDVEFNGAVRYIGHFPEQEGDILQIKFRTITFGGEKNNQKPRKCYKKYDDSK